MWNKRNIVTGLILVIFLAVISIIIFSDFYQGYVYEDTVTTGTTKSSKTYIVEISDDLVMENYKDGQTIMGYSLMWENPNAFLVTTIEYLSEQSLTDEMCVRWLEVDNLNKGTIIVEPGERYRIKVTAVQGSSKYTLRVFKPENSFSSAEEHTNQIGNLKLFKFRYRDVIPENEHNNQIFVNSQNSFLGNILNPKLYIFDGSTGDFLDNKNFEQAIEVPNVTLDTFIILDQTEGNFLIQDKNLALQKVDVQDSFNKEVPINNNSVHRYTNVLFPQNTKYLILAISTGESVDIKIKLRDSSNNIIRESTTFNGNLHFLNLKDLDLTKQYDLEVKAESLIVASTKYRITILENHTLKKIDLGPSKHASLTFLSDSNNDNVVDKKVFWYTVKPEVLGNGEFKLKWSTPSNDISHSQQIIETNTNTEEFGAKVIYFKDGGQGVGKVREGSEGELPIPLEIDNLNSTYMIKIVLDKRSTYEIDFQGVTPSALTIPEDYSYNDGMFELIWGMHVNKFIDKDQFFIWYDWVYRSLKSHLKFVMFDILAEKYRSENSTLDIATLESYYDQLCTMDFTKITSVLKFLADLHEAEILKKDGFLNYYSYYLKSKWRKYQWQVALEQLMIKKYLNHDIPEADPATTLTKDQFLDWLNIYSEIEPNSHYNYVYFLKDLLDKNYLTFAEHQDYNFVGDLTQLERASLIKIILAKLQGEALTITELTEVFNYFLDNSSVELPGWLQILFNWAVEIKDAPVILVNSQKDKANEPKIGTLQTSLDILGFPFNKIDGVFGPTTNRKVEDFKKYHNNVNTVDQLTIQPDPNGAWNEEINFKMLSYILKYYMTMDKKLLKTFDSDQFQRLTYFSANEKGSFKNKYLDEKTPLSVLYDLESISLQHVMGYGNLFDGLDQSRSWEKVNLTWKLKMASGYNHSIDPKTGTEKIYEGDDEGSAINKLVLFKGPSGEDRLMVKWLVEGNDPIEVGSLECYEEGEFKESFPLKIYPLDYVAYHKNNPDIMQWDTEIYNHIKEIRNGTKIMKKNVKIDVPYHMILGKIQRESSFKEGAYRYEPFWDMKNFYMKPYLRPDKSYYILKMKEAGDAIGVILNNETTIYEKFAELRDDVYPIDKWNLTPQISYIELEKKSADLANRYLEMYLDYGYLVGLTWFKKVVLDLKDKSADEIIQEMNMFYPDTTSVAADKWFDEKIWKHIKTVTFKENGAEAESIIVNSEAEDDDFKLYFTKPAENVTDQRWDVRWEENEKQITFNYKDAPNPMTWEEGVKDELIKQRNARFREIVREIATKIDNNNEVYQISENVSKAPVDVLKDFLEIYIAYDHREAIEWYDFNFQDDPRVLLPKPFIAQTAISASYGPTQIMYETAWSYGYRKKPNDQDDKLSGYKNAIKYGMYILVRDKHNGTSDERVWIQNWNQGLLYYNGGNDEDYPYKVRRAEKEFLPKPKINTEE